MDAGTIVTLLSLTITNVVALCIAYIRQKRHSERNYGIKNGRGDLFKQIVPKSPLNEALKEWKETTKQIRKNRNDNSRYSRKV